MQMTVSQLDDSRFEEPAEDEGTPFKVVLGDLAIHDSYHIGQFLE